MLTRRALATLGGSLLLLGTLSAADPRATYDQPNRKWIKGPVRCLVTDEEEKQFKALKADSEIAAFVKDFWSRRDPTPDTPVNEFADLFWKRVEEADRLFVQTTDTGALSDRGQVYLLLGRATKMPPPGKTMDWVYENVPNIEPSTFTIQFGFTGNWLLLGKKHFEELIAANEFLRGRGEKARLVYAPKPAEPELPAVSDLAPPPEVTTEESKILDGAAGSDLLPSAIPLKVRADVFEAVKGDSFVVITLGVPRAVGGASLVGFARLIPEAADARPVTLAAADSFAPADPENSDPNVPLLLFQGGAGVHPGRYTLLAGVRDPADGRVGILKQSVEAPVYEGAGLKLSTPVLASRLARSTPPAVGEGKKAPFFLGSFRVVPSLDGEFRQGSDLAWYYQVYNAAPDPATGHPNLTIEYNFLLNQLDKAKSTWEYRPVTAPQVVKDRTSQVEAFSFQLVKPTPTQKGWVEGDYRLTIKVTDEVAKTSVSQELSFKVVP
jgi:GWxTD domain-containing protein